MKRRSFLKILGLSALSPRVMVDMLSKIKTTTWHYGRIFVDKTGKFFIGSRKSYVMWDGKELKIRGNFINNERID